MRPGRWRAEASATSSPDASAISGPPTLKLLERLEVGYHRPTLTKTLIREYRLGERAISDTLGTSMHVFLLNLPRLEFAALIPKGDYVTMCLLGEGIDNALGDAFAGTPEVQAVMPPGWQASERSCQCLPHINIQGVEKPYADRLLFIGDCGVTRLYKDGIGAAYRTAKSAARSGLRRHFGSRLPAAVLAGVPHHRQRQHAGQADVPPYEARAAEPRPPPCDPPCGSGRAAQAG